LALQAQLLQQPSLEGLPDVLLHRIMCIVWDARPASEASSEVQLALSLQCLSRRFQQVLLRAHPLPLRLDFSNMQLAERHLAWLALPAWKDHVASLTLYNWLAPACEGRSRMFLDPGLCTENDVVSPLLTVLHANQRGSLWQLLGMPLRLGGVCTEPPPDSSSMSDDQFVDFLQRTPHVDLSALHLTHLGVSGGFDDDIEFNVLPQMMISLSYRAAYEEGDVSFSQSFGGALADVDVYGGSPAVFLTCSQALDDWHASIEGESLVMNVWSADDCPHLPSSTSTGTTEVRIDARHITACYYPCAGEENLGFEALLDVLCPPRLERVEVISGGDHPDIDLYPGQHDIPNAWKLLCAR